MEHQRHYRGQIILNVLLYWAIKQKKNNQFIQGLWNFFFVVGKEKKGKAWQFDKQWIVVASVWWSQLANIGQRIQWRKKTQTEKKQNKSFNQSIFQQQQQQKFLISNLDFVDGNKSLMMMMMMSKNNKCTSIKKTK